MLWKWCTQYASKFEKLSSGHRTGKGQFSFQSQRKAMPKNVQTTTQLHSSNTSKVAAVLLMGQEITNLKIKLSLRCHAEFKWMCVTPLQVNESMHSWERIRNHILGVWNHSDFSVAILSYIRIFRIWSRRSLTFPLNGFLIPFLKIWRGIFPMDPFLQ